MGFVIQTRIQFRDLLILGKAEEARNNKSETGRVDLHNYVGRWPTTHRRKWILVNVTKVRHNGYSYKFL